ncbi:MAG: cytochrome P450 [Ilumatobacter sp.]|jgi:cytochrome P450|uniref:cytochrome P450 n=1 Tax=Ilumatobacter sp. TaxID=1967498 RepID=UPI001DFE8293|nr:cytochrome P450 [Ilumatobacter sp.]MBT5276447.1 cytochrome P450 [Ilumatobacter sp.]MBT5554110.1 cytochrome P450 [Ilumatobacter sp.]MBT5865224.1 cytochrome P450 [Ilumatobacter sp.]MBT7429162.1 cytochrome P450 [Ilumatobacter sp.]
MTPLTETPMFNPLEAGYMENPYPHFAEMRDGQPVHLSMMDVWVLFDHDDVFRLLRDPSMSVMDAKIEVRDEERYAEILEAAGGELEQDSSMLNTDPPDHTRLRRLVSKAFTPAAIQALRPRIQELVDAALNELAAAGTGDIVKQLAFPLPFDVISEMLGMPESDKDQIAAWSGTIVKSLDPMLALDSYAEIRAASDAMNAHIDEVIRWKRENPGDDLLTALIAAEEGGDRLTPAELRDQVNLLFIAGHETTVNLIGTGIYELLRHPEQAAIWRGDPELDATAVDEMLRFVSPVQFSRRITLDDIDFQGTTIPKGMFVLAGLASSNHDPKKWGPTAEELDVRRDGAGQHLSFGSGAHYCLGASLAKLEASIAIGTFLRRFPDAAVSGDVEWNGRINLRGLEYLPVTL